MDFRLISFHIAPVSALLFDTLRVSRTLRDKGHFTSEQAEALAEALGEAAQGDLAIALLILDGAGWHSSPQLIVPENIVLMPLPPYAPELNSVENIWDYLRSNFLSHCVWDSYEAILDACCDAWNALMAKSEVIASIGTRDWAQVKT